MLTYLTPKLHYLISKSHDKSMRVSFQAKYVSWSLRLGINASSSSLPELPSQPRQPDKNLTVGDK